MMPGEQEGDRKVVIGSAISDKDKDKWQLPSKGVYISNLTKGFPTCQQASKGVRQPRLDGLH